MIAQTSAESPEASRWSGGRKEEGTSDDAGRLPLAQGVKRSNRAPTVKPAVHLSEPESGIPAGEAGEAAAQPSGNLLSRIFTGTKPAPKRIPLPVSENQSATNDETLDGF